MTAPFKISRAFTLIELLVVIAIIAILTAIITANFTSSKAKARDAKRISDINQIQLALQFYFDRCSAYPATLAEAETSPGCPSGINLGTFISHIPTPPQIVTNASDYRYGLDANKTDYILATQLEANNSSILSDDIDTSTYSVDCDDTAFNYCVGPK